MLLPAAVSLTLLAGKGVTKIRRICCMLVQAVCTPSSNWLTAVSGKISKGCKNPNLRGVRVML